MTREAKIPVLPRPLRVLAAACVAVFAAPCLAQADWTTANLDNALLYRGKPVDPRCVTALAPAEGGAGPVVLARCTRPGRMTRNGASVSVQTPDPGAILRQPYDSYEVLGRSGERFVVAAQWNGGGTGRFDNLMIVRREGNRLTLEKSLLKGGDRCNGGLSNVSVRDGVLRWSENNTPYDLVARGGIRKLADKDLESSANSCVATRNMAYHLDGGTTRLMSVSLLSGIADRAGWTERYTYQHCFNAYYNGYIARGRAKLADADIAQFAKGFSETCLPRRR